MADAPTHPTPTRAEVVAALRDEMLTITGDMRAVVRIQARGPVHRLAMARAALAMLTETGADPYPDAHNVGALTVSAPDPMTQSGADDTERVSTAYTFAPDPWGEEDAEWFDNTAAITTPEWAAARYRRAAQRARGLPVTEDGR